jgi:hypothetical protein
LGLALTLFTLSIEKRYGDVDLTAKREFISRVGEHGSEEDKDTT